MKQTLINYEEQVTRNIKTFKQFVTFMCFLSIPILLRKIKSAVSYRSGSIKAGGVIDSFMFAY